MKNTVEVVANKAGEIITVSPKNADYGWITLKSEAEEFNNGFLRYKQRFAFLTGTQKELQLFVDKHGLVEGSEIEGRIVVLESLEPVDDKNPETGIKYPNAAAKEAGLACTLDDSPVYRRTLFTKSPDMLDEFVAHNNQEDIKAFMLEQQAAAAKPATNAVRSAGARRVAGVK